MPQNYDAPQPSERNDEALRRSEERFRRVVEASPSAMVMIGRRGIIQMVNAQTERVFGYSRSELLGKSVEILIPERFRREHPNLRGDYFDSPEPRPMGKGRIFYGRRKDGSEFPIEIGLNPVENDNEPMVLSAIVDVSDRQQANLQASYLAAIVASSGDAIIGKALDGTITSWNPAAQRLFGYSESFAIGQSISLLIPPDRSAEEDNILAILRRGDRLDHFETVRRRADGTDIDVSLTVSPIRDISGKIVGASKIVRDITELKYSADRLRRSEERFRSIFGAIAEGIFIADPNTGVFTEVNEPGARMYGYAVDEMIGLDIAAISSGDAPYDLASARAWIEKAAATGTPQTFDWYSKDKSGRLFWTEISIQIGIVSGGSVVIAIARDVTERRQLEAQLRQALKMEAIGTLAGGVAHELNNLLQPIIMMTELVMTSASIESKEFKQLEHVVDAGVKATEIVQRILDFGRAGEVSHGLIELNLVVGEAVSFIRTILPSTVALTVEIDKTPRFIRGDKTQITQILINLATNARDAMGDTIGRLLVSLSTNQDDLELVAPERRTLKRRQYALLAVEDSGAGMDCETAQRIFEPFFTTKEVGKGTGLGLSVTHGIVTGHGGIIQVDTQPGLGTRFSIFFPLEQSEDSTPGNITPMEEM